MTSGTKSSADSTDARDATFKELREAYKLYVKLYNSRQQPTDGGYLTATNINELGLLAARIRTDLGLRIGEEWCFTDLYGHDDLPVSELPGIGALRTPKTQREYLTLNTHIAARLESIARDNNQLETLRGLLQQDIDKGTRAMFMLETIAKLGG
jgi:hypothetical protein